jgi:hypothetical protein
MWATSPLCSFQALIIVNDTVQEVLCQGLYNKMNVHRTEPGLRLAGPPVARKERSLSVLTTCTSTEVGLWARIDWHFLKVFLFHVLHFQ